MFANRLAFAALGMACIGAAAAGGYLATRQNTIPTPAAAEAQVTAPVASSPVQAAPPRAGNRRRGRRLGVEARRRPTAAVETAPKDTPPAAKTKRVEPQTTVARASIAPARTAARADQHVAQQRRVAAACRAAAPPATTDAAARRRVPTTARIASRRNRRARPIRRRRRSKSSSSRPNR